MYYYEIHGKPGFSTQELKECRMITEHQCRSMLEIDEKNILFFIKETDITKRVSFSITDPSMLFEDVDDLEVIRSNSNLTSDISLVPTWIIEKIKERKVRYINIAHKSFMDILSIPKEGKWRVNIVGLGDIGSNLLIGLKLLGGDHISEIGVYSVKQNVMKRYEMELNQVYSIDEDSPMHSGKPVVKTVEKENIMDCDMFIFCASSKVPPVGSEVGDVRVAQYDANREILAKYVKKTRDTKFKGIFAIVSDPVEMLCKAAYEMSNKNESGEWDYNGMLPEQIQGFGLGVMYSRALYYANLDAQVKDFKKNGRAYGMHGNGLVICDDIHDYNEKKSVELTDKTVNANLMVRELGFKPYIAPALSSGAISIISRIAGKYNYSSIFIDGAYLGIKNRVCESGIEIERIPMKDELFTKIQETHTMLKNIK